jgi:hypothetical protein
MRFCKTLAIVAVVALAMFGAKSAKADGLDPKVKLVIPTDPTIEPCSSAPEGDVCFATNDESNPVPIVGPTVAQLESGLFDITTDFIYEPDDANCNANTGVCPNPAADALMDLWIAITPTVPGASYDCDLGTVAAGVTPAFNVCPKSEGVSGSGLLLLELECDPTPSSPCTGMLPGEAGSAEVTPEPGDLALLGVGIALVGFFGWKRRQAIEPRRVNQENLAAC